MSSSPTATLRINQIVEFDGPGAIKQGYLRERVGDMARVESFGGTKLSIPMKALREPAYDGPTAAQVEAIQDMPTVVRMRRALDLVGDARFMELVAQQTKEYRPSTVDQEAMIVESVAIHIVALDVAARGARSLALRDIAPISDRTTWPAYLATMPETALLATIKAHSQVLNTDWLQTFVDLQVFDVGPESSAATDAAAMQSVIDAWTQRVQAFTGFISGITFDQQPQSDGTEKLAVAVFGAPEPVKALYGDFVRTVVDQLRLLEQHATLGGVATGAEQIDLAMGYCLAGAVVLDLPDACRSIVGARRGSLVKQIPLPELGGALAGLFSVDSAPFDGDAFVNAAYVAIQLSRVDCLDVLIAEGLPSALPLGRWGRNSVLTVEKFCLGLTPHCSQLMMTHLMNKLGASQAFLDSGDRAAFAETGVTAMTLSPRGRSTRDFILTMARHGWFDTVADEALKEACNYGFAEVVAAVGPLIDWKSRSLVDDRRLFGGVGSGDVSDEDRELVQDALLVLVDVAQQAGQVERILEASTQFNPQGSRGPAVFGLAAAGFHRTIVRLLEVGLDPLKPIGSDGKSLLADADENAPEAAAVIRTFVSRRRAAEIIDAAGPTPALGV
ncbi:hypothetical protein ACSFA0_25220 [Variovorax sp. LT1P1]|uniref:hypothetical protein n=1 Tax=Variovorax sp. LT1P1 TaxID=3443730 RepID=UPI003F44F84A